MRQPCVEQNDVFGAIGFEGVKRGPTVGQNQDPGSRVG